MKGLPLAYNSDMQEDKEPFFDSADTLEAILTVLPPLLGSLTFRTERMRAAAGEHFATATDLADYLVRKGVPFREAHEVVGRVVRHALDTGKTLEAVSLDELRRFSDRFGADVAAALSVEALAAGARGQRGHGPRRRPPGAGPGSDLPRRIRERLCCLAAAAVSARRRAARWARPSRPRSGCPSRWRPAAPSSRTAASRCPGPIPPVGSTTRGCAT